MDRAKKHGIIRFIKLFNLVVMTLLFAYVWFVFYNTVIGVNSPRRFGVVFVFLYSLIYYSLVRVYEGFKISIARISEVVYSQTLSLLFSDGLMFMVVWLLYSEFPRPVPMLLLFVVQALFSAIWAFTTNKIYYRIYDVRKAIAIYRDDRDYDRMWDLDSVSQKFNVVRKIRVESELDDSVYAQIEGMDTVFIRGLPTNDRNEIIKFCVEKGIEVYLWPKIGDVIMCGAEHTHMFHVPMMRINRYSPNIDYLITKRFFDIVLSLFGIIVASPFMLITALAIKLQDGGPVLYKQVRLTKDERQFKILKFRSMRIDAEKDGVARLSTGDNDDRITPVGKVIRAIRFDELPQLFNILKGDMSIVGPRPERPEIAEQYIKEMPEFRLRLQTKSGLTGYAQVFGKYNSLPYDKLQMDLLYIARPSIFQDLRIILATIKILFMKESTEGVADGQTTAAATDRNLSESEKTESLK